MVRSIADNHRRVGIAIRESCNELAATLVAAEFGRHPELEQRYGSIGRQKSLEDAQFHLNYLASAVEADSPSLFQDYVAWAKVVLASRGVHEDDLAFHLEMMREAMQTVLPGDMHGLACQFVDAGRAALPTADRQVPTFLIEQSPFGDLARGYLQMLLSGERQEACRLVLDAVAAGASVRDIYLHVFQRVLYEIGRLWQLNEINVAQEHFCTAATQLIMSQLYTHIFRGKKPAGSMVATAVAGDLHELGVRMLADFFELDGWNTCYLGANTPHRDVIQTVIKSRATVLCVSATISYHVHQVRALIDGVRQNPDAGKVIVLVGGYPFNVDPELWRKVGANGFARDAAEAVALARQFTGNPGTA